MSVRVKILLLIGVIFAAYMVASPMVQHYVVYPSFVALERDEAAKNQDRCVEAIEREIQLLSDALHDWSSWNDTYEFIVDGNEAYKANLISAMFTTNRLNLVSFLDLDGRQVWGEGYDFVHESPMSFEAFSGPRMDLQGPLFNLADPTSAVEGIMLTEHGPMMVASRRILTTDNQGPTRGTMIRGRLLDEGVIKSIADRTHVDMDLLLIPGQTLPPEAASGLAELASGSPLAMHDDDDDGKNLCVHSVLRGIDGAPALLMATRTPREITRQGRTAMRVAVISDVIVALAIIVLMWTALQRTVLGPLVRLTNHAMTVARTDELSKPIAMRRTDEFGTLAGEFDHMMLRLAESRNRRTETAHGAGMSQVAGNVLHNVGNVLSSVCVSADAIKNQLHKSEAGTLKAVSKMLAEHENDLGEFLTRNERGRQIPAFISAMAEQLGAEQQAMLSEVQSLTQAIEHIRHVVTRQQQHTGHKALIEMLEPNTIVEQAITLCAESFTRHNIKIHRDVQELGALPLDKHRILQVVVNLLTNAIQAVKETKHGKGQVTLHVSRRNSDAGDELIIRVEDDGVGVRAENLERVFAFGFTTRPGGQGIGLHSAANMAKEMGGSLAAIRKEPGTGAAFELTIPLTRQEVQA